MNYRSFWATPRTRNFKGILLTLGLMLSQLSLARAESTDDFQFFQEEAKVVTASRREQSIQEVPEAVDVITPAEIQTSGATNLWDLLRFRVGMDVLDARSVEGNRAIVAVRGFAQEFVGNLQVLVDGRSVYQPVDSGVFWDQLPVQMQDIERIEIIRGPNSALYGSGAGLGVINIITKKPTGPTAVAVKTWGGNQDMVQSAESLESSVGPLAYRVSTTFQQQDGFPTPTGSTANDFLHTNKANLRTQWTFSEGSELALFMGRAWSHEGIPEATFTDTEFDQHFEMLKYSQRLGDHSSMEISSSRNEYTDNLAGSPGSLDNNSQVIQYDEDLLQRIEWGQSRLNTTYGINFRNARVTSPTFFANAAQKEDLWNGYFNQSLRVTDQWSLSGAVSEEASDIGSGNIETNYQAASLWAPWENQTFRATYAVAHTIPSLLDAGSNLQISPGVDLTGNPDLESQKLTSYELGFRSAELEKRLEIDTSLYYTTIQNMASLVTQSITFVPAPVVTLGFADINQAIARGVETEVKYHFNRACSVYVNYTYEHVSDWQGNAGDITQNTPAHKLNLGGMADLGYGFSGSANLGYKDRYFIASDARAASVTVPAYWRLDARLAYAINKNVELFLAGQNLAAKDHLEFADGLVIARTYQGGMSVKFGGSR